MRITSGSLTEVIQIAAPDDTDDGGGGATPGWTLWPGTFRAAVIRDDRATQEQAINGGERDVSTMKFVVRRQVAETIRDGGGAALRIIWGGRNYEITSIGGIVRTEPFTWITATSGLTT